MYIEKLENAGSSPSGQGASVICLNETLALHETRHRSAGNALFRDIWERWFVTAQTHLQLG